MTTHRFEVNIPNPGPRATAVELSLEFGKPGELAALGVPVKGEQLKVVGAGIALDPCDERGSEQVRLKLAALESVSVYVVVATDGTAGAAVMHLVDRRGGKLQGGVMLACLIGMTADPPGTIVAPEVPCPAVLARDPYPMTGADPTKYPRSSRLVAGRSTTVVFPIHNPTGEPLNDTSAYLEHLGMADATFEPGTWQIGNLGPGETFFATWQIRAVGAQQASIEPCIVVGSTKTDPVRLRGTIGMAGKTTTRPSGTRIRRARARAS